MTYYSLSESLLSLKVLLPSQTETQSNHLHLFLIFSLDNNEAKLKDLFQQLRKYQNGRFFIPYGDQDHFCNSCTADLNILVTALEFLLHQSLKDQRFSIGLYTFAIHLHQNTQCSGMYICLVEEFLGIPLYQEICTGKKTSFL